MNGLDQVSQLEQILRTGGGWGLAAVLAFVVWRLVVYIRDQHQERIAEQASSIKLLECVKNLLSSNEKAFDKNTEKMERVERGLEKLLSEQPRRQ